MTSHTELLLDIAGRDDVRPVVSGRPVRQWRTALLLLPAVVLVGSVVLIPLIVTVNMSLSDTGYIFSHYHALFENDQVLRAIRTSLLWLVLAPVVCAVALLLAWLGRSTKHYSTIFIVVIAAPMAVSMLVAGLAFRLLFDPQPERGTATALVQEIHSLFVDTPPIPGARPAESSVLTTDSASGDLVTTTPIVSGNPIELALKGRTDSPDPGASPSIRLPVATSNEVVGLVTLNGRPASAVPIRLTRFGSDIARTQTDSDGVFQVDVSDQPIARSAQYEIRISSSAVADRWQAPAFIGPSGIAWVLVGAFTWSSLGLVLLICRAGCLTIPRDLLRMAAAYGVGRIGRLMRVVLPSLFPVIAISLLILLVAAARIFELVVAGAPGSVQDNIEVVGVHWWRYQEDLGPGEAASLAVLLFLLVAACALITMWGLSHLGTKSVIEPSLDQSTPRLRAPGRVWTLRALGFIGALVWLVPLIVLTLMSLHSPADAAIGSPWHGQRDGWTLASYGDAFANGELMRALLRTAARAIVATTLLLLIAIPAAYAIAWGRLSRRAIRVLTAFAAILAVVPVQVVAAPLATAFDNLNLFGVPAVLSLVHVALGVPFAVLLLRTAFAALSPHAVRRAQRADELASSSPISTVLVRCWPTVLAVGVLEFVLVWNDVVVGLLLGGPQDRLLTLVLLGQTREFATSAGVVAATAVVSMIVPLALVLGTMKWLMRGLTAGVMR